MSHAMYSNTRDTIQLRHSRNRYQECVFSMAWTSEVEAKTRNKSRDTFHFNCENKFDGNNWYWLLVEEPRPMKRKNSDQWRDFTRDLRAHGILGMNFFYIYARFARTRLENFEKSKNPRAAQKCSKTSTEENFLEFLMNSNDSRSDSNASLPDSNRETIAVDNFYDNSVNWKRKREKLILFRRRSYIERIILHCLRLYIIFDIGGEQCITAIY